MLVETILYTKHDGVRNVTDSYLEDILIQICNDGNLDKVFHDGYIQTASDFVTFCKSSNVLCFLVFADKQIVGFVWLTNLTGRTAFFNFTFLGNVSTRDKLKIGKIVTRNLLTIESPIPGVFVFDGLFGLTPETNPVAWRYALKCGFREVAKLPLACLVNGESVDGYLTYVTRGYI
jgi:hypothetical protein